jgi:tRNA A-37 threonylcarbamoyl transferase component Bud32
LSIIAEQRQPADTVLVIMGLPSTVNDPPSRRVGDVLLVEPSGPGLKAELAELIAPPAGKWQVVKHNPSRTVYFGRWGGRDVYLKHFHVRSPIRRLLKRLRGSDLWHEVNAWRCLAGSGVATPEVLAAGRRGNLEWLATAAVAPAERADEWHERQLSLGPAGKRAIRQAIAALAEMIAQMHQAGVVHDDLHCGNILIRLADGAPQPVLMDLHRVRRRWGHKLPRRARAANLARLYHDRACFTTRTERLRFLRHYLTISGAAGSLRGWQTMIEEVAGRHARHQYACRDRRILRRNRYFSPIRLAGGWRGHVVRATKNPPAGSVAGILKFRLEDWQRTLADPAALLAGDVEVVKDSPSSRVVRRILTVGPHRLDVFVKQIRRKYAWRAMVDCFRRAKAFRAFKLGHALLNRRIPTALPLAALERRVGPVLVDNILITEAVNAPNFYNFLDSDITGQGMAGATLTAAQRRHLAQQVPWRMGRLVQRLHDHGFAHRDLKAGNLLIRGSGGTEMEVVLVDLDGLSRLPWSSTRQGFRGLMRINVSLLESPSVNRAGRLRMLMGFLRRPGCGSVEFKPYWRILEAWSARLQRHKRRKALGRSSP